MNDEEEVVRRLRELGARPVPDHVRARHLRALDSASGLLPVRRGRPNRRLLVGSIAAMSLVLVGAAAIFAGGDSPDRGPVVITDDGGTTSDTPTTPSSTPTDRQQTPDQDEPADPFSTILARDRLPSLANTPFRPGRPAAARIRRRVGRPNPTSGRTRSRTAPRGHRAHDERPGRVRHRPG